MAQYMVGMTVEQEWHKHLPTPEQVLDPAWRRWHFLPGQVLHKIWWDVQHIYNHVHWLCTRFHTWNMEWGPKIKQYADFHKSNFEQAKHDYVKEQHQHHSAAVMSEFVGDWVLSGPDTWGFFWSFADHNAFVTEAIYKIWQKLYMLDRHVADSIMYMLFATTNTYNPPVYQVQESHAKEQTQYKIDDGESQQQMATILSKIKSVGGILASKVTIAFELQREFNAFVPTE